MTKETNELLFEATRQNNLDDVKKALNKGADINALSDWEGTALHIAASKGFLDIVKFLLDANADSTIKDKIDFTPLHFAARDGHVKIVQLLLDKGGLYSDRILADIGMVASMSVTSNPIISDLLRRQRIKQMEPSVEDLNQNDKLLFQVIYTGNFEGVKEALEQGANVNARDGRDLTALRWAVRRNHIEIVKYLLEQGAEINAISNAGWSALMESCLNGHTDIVKLLIDNNANVNLKTFVNATALYFAVYEGFVEIVKLLLISGAEPNVKVDTSSYDDEDSFDTPLMIAIRKGYDEIQSLLEEALNKN